MSVGFVVPACNEENKITRVLNNIQKLNPELIVVIANGCSDNTVNQVIAASSSNTHILEFKEALGIDVPRSIGAKYVYMWGAEIIVFVDGDMTGHLKEPVNKLISGVKSGTDLALVNCYPYITFRPRITEKILYFRETLNKEIGLSHKIGVSVPSHGPHAVSRRLLSNLGFIYLAVPPVELAAAQLLGLNIKVHAAIPHTKLGSTLKSKRHAKLISETIIGDCIEAIYFYKKKQRCRSWLGKKYEGYNTERRLDLLRRSLDNLDKICIKSYGEQY